ncbi:glycoside hydrolase family 2 TIM barrel-domain containing protein [Niabella drilacis]|uniref:glycoside hydrolase family 2 TIM barrel-domain containing protein n=1 Tax=Niabella drilacis (strain DSM 25811 / CCM 8410 / CCUG 62505 / LMG 26954 / E90) TaxID=1285928 RepID=UPI000B80A8E2|nr:glycoside hydrolase family 2 TIM barrel-domain containing protein [Niabella drilacis]
MYKVHSLFARCSFPCPGIPSPVRFIGMWGLVSFLLAVQMAAAQTGAPMPVLTPQPALVAGIAQPVQSLNGKWDFGVEGRPQRSGINVPGEWVMQGYTVNEGETALYSRTVDIPADWKGKRVKLRFEGVSSHAVVLVNGRQVAVHEGSFVPFEADITDALQPANNLLQVKVQSRTISDVLACTSQYAVHTVGGILRNVTLMAVPEAHINNLAVVTTFDRQYKNAILALNTGVSADASNSSILYILRNKEGKIVKQGTSDHQSPITNFKLQIINPFHWTPESPYLYELTAALQQDGKIIETIRQKIGFRQVTIKDARVYVNGKPIKLHGVNRHSVHPLTGRSIDAALDVTDAVLFREANCNFIRTSHYPPTEAFLNACDSLGLFVEDESSLCWIQHGASPIWKKWDYRDERFLPYMLNANIEKMMAHRNHPSVIMWSLGNESAWSPLWEKVNAAVKALDPTRPTLLHDQCWGGFNNFGSKADIANYHYPGINGGRATDTMSRPVFFGEYAHLATYNRRELLTDPGQRAFYGEPLAMMYDSMYYYPKCLGGAIWSGIDDAFHLPGGRIVGYGPWGPLDAWRRKKPEYFGMKKAYTPVKVTGADRSSLVKGFIMLHIENRYDFTDLSNIKITATFDGGVPQPLTAAIPPHGKGALKIAFPRGTKELRVQFADPRGFIANEELYDLRAGEWMVYPPLSAYKLAITENDASITIVQKNIRFLISKSTGMITSVRKDDKELMTQGPVFAIIPRNSEDGGKPNVAGETYQNDIHPLKGYPLYTIFANDIAVQKMDDSVQVTMTVIFSDNSRGRMVYTFAGNRLKVHYEVEYKGNMEYPYQYGMLLQLPKTMDRLSWLRKTVFTAYPEDDIARPKGEARLNAKRTTGVEEWGVVPAGDWKDDATELGSNDFRSSKRNIYSATLSDAAGNAVKAWGGGKQTSRSWLQDGAILWLIADYCNNGSEPFYGSPFTDGRVNIKGQTLKGGVELEF